MLAVPVAAVNRELGDSVVAGHEGGRRGLLPLLALYLEDDDLPALELGGQVSAGSKRVRRHNRERGPYPLTAGPSDGPGVRRFWPPAIDSRRRGKSLSQGALFWAGNGVLGPFQLI